MKTITILLVCTLGLGWAIVSQVSQLTAARNAQLTAVLSQAR